MATSKETRVRVDGFSKIMASTALAGTPRAFGSLPDFLMRGRGVDDGAQGRGVQCVEIEEMLG